MSCDIYVHMKNLHPNKDFEHTHYSREFPYPFVVTASLCSLPSPLHLALETVAVSDLLSVTED